MGYQHFLHLSQETMLGLPALSPSVTGDNAWATSTFSICHRRQCLGYQHFLHLSQETMLGLPALSPSVTGDNAWATSTFSICHRRQCLGYQHFLYLSQETMLGLPGAQCNSILVCPGRSKVTWCVRRITTEDFLVQCCAFF